MQAIILAGGKGTRLKPFTISLPKPLVPIGDVPILELILKQLKFHGFKNIVIAVNHLSEIIMAFFGNGQKFDLNISYSMEEKELGTAGPLALVGNLEENFLVMNGDVLTTMDYKDLYAYHIKNNCDVTISTYRKNINIDLGVLEVKNNKFCNYIEKPTYTFDVSMGIYVFRKRVIDVIPRMKKMDMPDLMLTLKEQGRMIHCYTGDYYWLDIGRAEDYETANEIFHKRRKEFLP